MRSANNVVDEIDLFNAQQGINKQQYLTFILAGEEYGVDILRVQEIKGWENVTKIPNSPHYIKGVMNLRGSIVPIVDLRSRFNMEAQEYGPTTVVVVLRIETNEKQRIMGVVVDAVSDVYDINSDLMQPAPDFGDHISVDFIKGLATVEDKMVILLNVDCLLTYTEMESLKTTVTVNPESQLIDDSQNDAAKNLKLLEDSYAAIAPKGELIVERFYNELFSRYPDVKPLFANVSQKAQQNKLLAALQLVVTNLRNPEKLSTALQQLGARHKNYGADADLYKAVCATLLDVLKEEAGNQWNDKIHQAWEEALRTISNTMLQAAS